MKITRSKINIRFINKKTYNFFLFYDNNNNNIAKGRREGVALPDQKNMTYVERKEKNYIHICIVYNIKYML